MGEIVNFADRSIDDDSSRVTPLELVEEVRESLETADDVVCIIRQPDGSLSLANNGMKIEAIYFLISVAKMALMEEATSSL